MSAVVGDLFVNLGIKGADKTVSAITGVKKVLGETKEMSLEAKAGLLAAMYALERLVANSGSVGTGLTNFNAVLGVSAKTLQQYQYAARQMGVSNQEVEGSFKSLQAAMSKTLMNGDAPKGMARLAQLTGNIGMGDILRFQKNPAELLQRLQEYAKKETNAGMKNEVLSSFGVGDGMNAALTRGAFTQNALARAPTYSDREIGSLDRANIAWSNLGNKIEMAVGHFNARHGMQLVKDISMITDSVIKLSEALITLADRFKVVEAIGHGLEGIANSMKLVSEIADKLQGKDSKKGDLLYTAPGQEAVPGFSASPVGKFLGDVFGGSKAAAPSIAQKSALSIPLPAELPQAGRGNTQVNVKQDLHFNHDGKDSARTVKDVKKAVQETYRQMPAQKQGS